MTQPRTPGAALLLVWALIACCVQGTPSPVARTAANRQLLQSSCEVKEIIKAGGSPVQGSAAPGQWVHYKLEVPMGTGSTALQVRVELLQPGRGSYGARLRVSNGPLDCYKTDGFDYEAERSELCRPGACQEIEWVLVPAVTGPLHVAVLGAGESFRLYAQSAPLELLQVSMPAAGGSVKLAGLARVGFAAWYRVDNNIEVPDRGLSQHTFEVQSASAGQACRLEMFRVTSADEGKGLAELVSRPAEAVRWSMATYGWSQALGFSEANVTGAASSFLVGLQVLPSGVDVTRRDQFLPCTLSGLGKEMSKIDDCVGSANGFNLQVAAAPASVSIAEIMGASEVVVQGKVDNGGGRALQGRMDSGEYRFLSLRIPPGAAQGQGIWDNASALLVRVSLQLRDGHAGLSTASRIPRGSLRASAASAFPLEQLGAGQYQIANQCSPNCTLVVPVTPGTKEVKLVMEVERDDSDFIVGAWHMDLRCGWLPTCSQCSEAAAEGLGCAWALDGVSHSGGFCYRAGDGEGNQLGRFECPAGEREAEAQDCHVPGSISGAIKGDCAKCSRGCGWCGQPFGGGEGAGACVPEGLALGTSWVGGKGPSAHGGPHLMGTGYCAAWDVVDLGEPNRGPGACNILSQDAQMGACDLGSSSCEVCGALAPVCAFCADPADPSKGRCVPINSDAQVCEIDAPWLGYGPSGSSCPPTSTPALPLQQSSALSVVLPAPVILKVAVGPASVGAKHGLASNAVYLSHPLGRGASLPASVENLRIHVRATTGASFRVSARLDALPVPSAHAAAASQTWMGAGEERVMSVAVLLSSRMPPHHLYVALEQPASSGAKEEATAEVWLESFSETLTPGGPTVAGAICCGGSAVYEVKTDEGGGNYVVIYMEAKGPGSRGVLLHVSSDAIPTRGSYVYAGQEGNARQQVSVHLGEKGDEAQMLERWYVAVLATEESNAAALSSWEETETTFTLRAEKETVTEELILDPTFAYVSLPIWAWVLISVGVGLLMGFVLLVAAYVNKVIYKSIRRKLYKLGDGQTPMASPRSQGGDACLMMQSGEGWLYSASHDEALSTKGDDLNKEPVSKIRLGSPFARLLAGINSRTPKWYDPKTFRAADSERNAEVLEGQPESHTFRAEALLLEPYLIPSPKAVLERKVEMIDIPEGEALQTAEVAPTSLIENINNQLWRTSVVASSVTAFEGDAETPTSAGGTPANSIGGFSVLNERMAVLAQAEELEERRKPRPDSSNPVRFPSQTSRAPGTDDIDSHVTVITLRDKFAQACDKYAPGPSPRPKLDTVPEPPREPSSTEGSPTVSPLGMNQRRRAPPPLSVVVESTEPTGDEILMLSEEQAGTISRPSAMDHNNVRASWVANSSGFADQVISQDASSPELGTSLVEQFQVDDSPRRLPGASNLPAAEATMPSAHRYNPNGDAEDTMMC